MQKLIELKKTLCAELEEYAKRGNNLDLQSLDTIDKLAHAIKNICKVIEADERESEYSNRYSMRNSYEGGWSNARGRYSYGDTMESFKKLMDNAPDEQTKAELNRMMQRYE